MVKRERPSPRPNSRSNRGSDMDDALLQALGTSVPDKDTGPDPDDILSGLFDDDEEGGEDISPNQAGENRSLAIELNERDRSRAEQIMQLVRAQTGEQIELAQAIKMALFLCPLDEGNINKAYTDLKTHKSVNQ